MMKLTKKIVAGCALVLSLSSAAIMTFAATAYQTPAHAAAGVTGKTLEEVTSLRQSGKSYGTIAAEAGKLEEFHQAVLDIHRQNLENQVADGYLTREQADELLEAVEERQENCDGMGTNCGIGCGLGSGYGSGLGTGYGCGYGRGNGRGMGMRNGNCQYR